MGMKAKGQLALYIWTTLFFLSFWLTMWSWKWQIAPLVKAAGTFGGIAFMVVCYRYGIERSLQRLGKG